MENVDANPSTPSNECTTPSSASWLSGMVRSRSDSFKRRNNSSGDYAGSNWVQINSKGRFHGVMFKYGPAPVQDAMELDQLLRYFIYKEESDGVVLLGHSTGCQDIVHYMRRNAMCSMAVRGAILQAPVSDREYKATFPETASMIDLASKMISDGRASEWMPREANPDSPITAYSSAICRYHSLFGYNGDDDMFSSDFSESQLKQKLGHMSKIPTLVMYSMADEFVPHYIGKDALVDRLCTAMGGAEKIEIERGNHTLSNRVEEAVQAITAFVKSSDGRKIWEDPWS
ncbi:fusarinine C esterase sidJ isoform X3 [Andrographis paniculata]|uniref:fusarinine C esterase sidJ isoform X3 n=1 Tax=Andrographis paniculata TaxID=175694 RepID=UPI0021E8EEED|nr:fusarinine C esterase sidJ isoform X3 [Andrographis paniculata]